MVETILRAAARVLVKHGYDGTNTNLVAAAAGVSVGSLYQYFPNKEALVATLLTRHMDTMWALFESKSVLLQHAPLEVAARELVRTQIAAHAVNPTLHRVLFEQVPRTGQLSRVYDNIRRVTDMVEAYLALHRAEVRPRDLGVAAFIVVRMVTSVSQAAVLDRPALLAEGSGLIDETTDAVLRYLRA